MRAANYAADEQKKKKKDDKEKKRQLKQRAKLQRGKQRQGSSEEEGEDDGSISPIPWDDLTAGDKDPPSPQVGPFLWHFMMQEGEDVPLEPA